MRGSDSELFFASFLWVLLTSFFSWLPHLEDSAGLRTGCQLDKKLEDDER
jgi:hypothetical protein